MRLGEQFHSEIGKAVTYPFRPPGSVNPFGHMVAQKCHLSHMHCKCGRNAMMPLRLYNNHQHIDRSFCTAAAVAPQVAVWHVLAPGDIPWLQPYAGMNSPTVACLYANVEACH